MLIVDERVYFSTAEISNVLNQVLDRKDLSREQALNMSILTFYALERAKKNNATR